ncbi:MAG: hypothetical protein RQ757_11210 [Pseudomonadales bacterium]|nr:hypothetical protein [Pseudomonadales bacterium]
MRTVTLLVMLLLMQSALGQDQSQDQSGGNVGGQEAVGQTGADGSVAASEPTDAANAEAAPEQGEGNERFIPSEQISRDLGVSFPTDI